MKKIIFFSSFLFIANNVLYSQIGIFQSEGISIGDTIDPGCEKILFYDPVQFIDSANFNNYVQFNTGRVDFFSDLIPRSSGLNLGDFGYEWNELYIGGNAHFSDKAYFTGGFDLSGITNFNSSMNINSGFTAAGNLNFHAVPSASGSIYTGGSVYMNPINSNAEFISTIPSTMVDLTVYSFHNYSDEALKTDIRTIEGSSLSKLKSLHGITYKFKDEREDGLRTGFLAQNVQEIFPELVSEKKDGLAVNYIEIIPHLVEAIKEQESTISELETELEEMNQEIIKLKQVILKNDSDAEQIFEEL